MVRHKKFQDYHLDTLKNQEAARVYLEIALEEFENDGDLNMFYRAIKDVADAQGGMTQLAKKTNLNRQHLYKITSGTRSPRLDTISHLVHGLGFQLALKPISGGDSTKKV